MGPWCGGRRRQALAAAALTVVLCLAVRGRLSSVPVQPGDRAVRRRPSCSVLSIVCAAEASEEGLSAVALPDQLRSSSRHVLLAGHSRLRQVFEQLQPLLGAPLRARADRPPPLPDRDDPRAPHLPANSTCLAALPKPKLGTRDVWCSMAADWGRTLVDFRWRHLTGSLAALLSRLAARPPDRLIIAHGLYQDGTARTLASRRTELRPAVARLRQLRQRGTDAAWMLEAAKNDYTELGVPVYSRGLTVINALLSELALQAGVPLWSAHLATVQHWILTQCRRLHGSGAGVDCEQQQLHTDPATARLMAAQLLEALTEPAWSPDLMSS